MFRVITKRLRSLRIDVPAYIDVPALRPGTIGAYALAVVSAGIATALRLAVDPYVEGVQFVTFWPAVILTTLIGGFGAGLLCAVLSTAAVDFFMLTPRWSFNVGDPFSLANLLLFGPLVFSSVILLAWMRIAVEREQGEQTLRASKDRLQSALDAAHLGWWHYDPLSRAFSWDARSKEIFDAPEDATSLEEFMTWVHTDDVERFWADYCAALNPAEPKRTATQFRLRRGEGKVRWVESFGLTYFKGDGRDRRAVSVVGASMDITERKEREEKEHLLMREVNHRARNMLGVVAAIARETVPKDYAEHLSERIRALAAYQDLLVRSEWTGVEIEDLARAQLWHFADLIGSRIVMNGPKLRLNPASAQAIGLALHELAANAGNYGALSTDAGRVDVGWGTDGETLIMSWTEQGGPPVSPPKRRGFGSTAMATMAERTLDGKVDLEYAPSGVTWRLTCPAANALEDVGPKRLEF